MSNELVISIFSVIFPAIAALSGVFLAEILAARRSRRAFLTKEVMQRKLDLYEQLYDLVQSLNEEAQKAFDIFETAAPSRRDDISKALDPFIKRHLELGTFTTKNRLYIDRPVAHQITMFGFILSGFFSSNGGDSEVDLKNEFALEYSKCLRLIEEYSGTRKVNKELRRINKARMQTSNSKFLRKILNE